MRTSALIVAMIRGCGAQKARLLSIGAEAPITVQLDREVEDLLELCRLGSV